MLHDDTPRGRVVFPCTWESAMPIEFHCFSCGQRLRVAEENQGQRARCPRCQTVLDIPRQETTEAPILLNATGRAADVIDYEVFGHEMQYVEITLDPGEVAIAEAGAMMYMSPGIEMETVLGDASNKQSGLLGRLMSAGQRVLTGESLFMTAFFNSADTREVVAFAAPYPGKLVPMHLAELGHELICQKDSFLCTARGIEISVAFQKNVLTGLFGGEGFIMQRLTGDGVAVVHAGGTLLHRKLDAGETLHIDTGCLVALTASVSYNIRSVSGIKNAFFGGEGMFLATLTGPGDIWLQSLPFSRLAGRMLCAGRGFGRSKGEGSLLAQGPLLGNLFMGDGD